MIHGSSQPPSPQSETQPTARWVSPRVFFTIAVGLFVSGGLIDPLLGSSIPAQEDPDFGLSGLLTMTCSVFSALFFVEGLVLCKSGSAPSTNGTFPSRKLIPDAEGWGAVGILAVSLFDSVKRPIKLLTIKEGLIWLVLVLSSGFSVVLLSVPWLFSLVGQDDGFLERLSVWLWFLCSGMFLYVLYCFQHSAVPERKRYVVGFLILIVVSLAVGMDKVSWLYHPLSVKTTEAFAGTVQETFGLLQSSIPSLNLFHVVAFFFLIVVPFVHDQTAFLKRSETLSFFIPSRFILLTSAIMVAYNYGMWNLLWTQWGFFVCLFILLYYAWAYSSENRGLSMPLVLLGVVAATQALFLLNGEAIAQPGLLANFKELFIPLGFLFYSLEILQKTGIVCHVPGQPMPS